MLRGYAAMGLEDVALWHERDISHSSVERVAIPDACLVLDFALARMNRILSGLAVDADRMRLNLDASRGTIFSQAVLLALVRHGLNRDAAYRIVQTASASALSSGRHLREVLAADESCPLSDDALGAAFDLDRHLAHAGTGVDHLMSVTPDWMRSRE